MRCVQIIKSDTDRGETEKMLSRKELRWRMPGLKYDTNRLCCVWYSESVGMLGSRVDAIEMVCGKHQCKEDIVCDNYFIIQLSS